MEDMEAMEAMEAMVDMVDIVDTAEAMVAMDMEVTIMVRGLLMLSLDMDMEDMEDTAEDMDMEDTAEDMDMVDMDTMVKQTYG